MASSSAAGNPTLYFAYGSNLWIAQMTRRCPDFCYVGVACLRGYKWFINERGFANIRETTSPNAVWGLVFAISPADEASLDRSEGVPWCYQKFTLKVVYWPIRGGAGAGMMPTDLRNEGTYANMLVYIDKERNLGRYKPRREYVVRMNNGIADALNAGVPMRYVQKVLRKYIPEGSPESGRQRVTPVRTQGRTQRRTQRVDDLEERIEAEVREFVKRLLDLAWGR